MGALGWRLHILAASLYRAKVMGLKPIYPRPGAELLPGKGDGAETHLPMPGERWESARDLPVHARNRGDVARETRLPSVAKMSQMVSCQGMELAGLQSRCHHDQEENLLDEVLKVWALCKIWAFKKVKTYSGTRRWCTVWVEDAARRDFPSSSPTVFLRCPRGSQTREGPPKLLRRW